MSIQDEIARLEREKRLFCLESRLVGEETARTLWVSNEVLEAVMPPYPENEAFRLSEFREFLDGWLEYGHFSVAENPDDKPAYAMLARVKPVEMEFWDFRVTAPKPGIRAFGAFAEYQTFVVLTWEYRDNIMNFDDEVSSCMEEWRKMFGAIPPFKKAALNEYLSNYTSI